MDSWLSYPEYQTIYPDTTLTEAEFSELAVDAALFIETATHWRAALAEEAEQQELLAQCQSRLVHTAAECGASWDGVTSVNNHGYTESYAGGSELQEYLRKRQRYIVETVLSAPATRWMLYAGGVYHPPRRR